MPDMERRRAYRRTYDQRPEVQEKHRQRSRNYYQRKKTDPEFLEKKRIINRRFQKTEKGKRLKCHYRLKREFGIGLEDYEAMREEQQGLCAICYEPVERPAVDHDHDTDKVRGLLCNLCNVGLGAFDDSPEILRAAVAYLARYGKQ